MEGAEARPWWTSGRCQPLIRGGRAAAHKARCYVAEMTKELRERIPDHPDGKAAPRSRSRSRDRAREERRREQERAQQRQSRGHGSSRGRHGPPAAATAAAAAASAGRDRLSGLVAVVMRARLDESLEEGTLVVRCAGREIRIPLYSMQCALHSVPGLYALDGDQAAAVLIVQQAVETGAFRLSADAKQVMVDVVSRAYFLVEAATCQALGECWHKQPRWFEQQQPACQQAEGQEQQYGE